MNGIEGNLPNDGISKENKEEKGRGDEERDQDERLQKINTMFIYRGEFEMRNETSLMVLS